MLPTFKLCYFPGFKYVPPNDSRVDVVAASTDNTNRQTACVPCKRDLGLSGGPSSSSSRFLWPTTAPTTTTTTAAPCCTDSGSKLQNATGLTSN